MKKLALVFAIACGFSAPILAAPVVIEQMYLGTFGHYTQDYSAGGSFMVFASADFYDLSNGASWDSGAGWHPSTYSTLAGAQVFGSKVRYTFAQPASGILFQNTDYDNGNHSAQGVLGVNGPLVIEADLGASTGKMWGYTTVLSNNATWYGEPRFNFYDAQVGDRVYFEEKFSLVGSSRFTQNLFQTNFKYNVGGVVDFTQKLVATKVPEPATGFLLLGALATLAAARRRRMR